MKTFYTACLVLFSLLPIKALTDFAWQNADYIEKAFIEIALKNEYKKTDMRIIRWQEAIRYQFIYEGTKPNDLLEGLMQKQLSHLASITKHPIQEASQPNLRIIFTRDEQYGDMIAKYVNPKARRLATESHCMGSFKLNSQHAISQGTVIIPTDHTFSKGLFVACVIEETTQLMGLPNDSDWVNPSIANDASKIEFLTGLDYVMLKLLYQENINAGMPLKTLKPILKENIQKLFKNKTIKKAPYLVNRQGLFRELN